MTDTRTAAVPSPADLLATHVVLTPGQVAQVLGLHHTKGARKGEPDRRRVIALVDAGHLRPVDPAQPFPRWTFAASAVRRYVEGEVAA